MKDAPRGLTDSTDEGRDQGDAGLGTGDGLTESEQEGQVAVNVVVPLQLSGGLDTLPGRGDLDQDPLPVDTLGLVESDELLGLVDGGLLVKRESGVDLGGDSAGNDLEDLLTELDEETVHGVVDLVVELAALGLGPFDRGVDELSVGGLVDGGEDQRGVGGGILGLVDGDGCGGERGVVLESNGPKTAGIRVLNWEIRPEAYPAIIHKMGRNPKIPHVVHPFSIF
jgi:hypothetical protein